MIVTEGENGVQVIGPNRSTRRVPVRKVDVVDICGAGDSFSAGAACALAATRQRRGGSVVRKPGRLDYGAKGRNGHSVA